jgi:hypothetical protein
MDTRIIMKNLEELPEWKARVFEEREAIDYRISRLESFLDSVSSESLSKKQIQLLRTQHEIMQDYSEILTLRLEN